MIKTSCSKCGCIAELDENLYEIGQTIKVNCQCCGEEVSIQIPEKKIPEEEETCKPKSDSTEKSDNTKTKSDSSESSRPKQNQLKATPVTKKVSSNKKKNTPTPPPISVPVNGPFPSLNNSNVKIIHNGRKSNYLTIIYIAIAVVLAASFGGMFYYNEIYLPEKIDREAPRFYTFASSLILRSSRELGVDYNRVASLPYGTRLITYENDDEWSEVKIDTEDKTKQLKGYVSSQYLLDEKDFKILNSIFGNADAREIIESARTKKALLNYYKHNNFIGKINNEERTAAGIDVIPNSENTWQLFCSPSGSKINTVKFQRLVDPESKNQDLGIILTNMVKNECRFLYFTFDENDNASLLLDEPAPVNAKLLKVEYNRNGKITPIYAN